MTPLKEEMHVACFWLVSYLIAQEFMAHIKWENIELIIKYQFYSENNKFYSEAQTEQKYAIWCIC